MSRRKSASTPSSSFIRPAVRVDNHTLDMSRDRWDTLVLILKDYADVMSERIKEQTTIEDRAFYHLAVSEILRYVVEINHVIGVKE